jgi:hypothetical protein
MPVRQSLSVERHRSLVLRILLVQGPMQTAQPRWSSWFAGVCEAATEFYIKIGHVRSPLIFYNSPTAILLTFDRTAKRTLNTLTDVTRCAPTHRAAPRNWRAGSGVSPVHFCSQWLISRYRAGRQPVGERASERLSFNALHRTPHLQTAERCTTPNTNSKQN